MKKLGPFLLVIILFFSTTACRSNERNFDCDNPMNFYYSSFDELTEGIINRSAVDQDNPIINNHYILKPVLNISGYNAVEFELSYDLLYTHFTFLKNGISLDTRPFVLEGRIRVIVNYSDSVLLSIEDTYHEWSINPPYEEGQNNVYKGTYKDKEYIALEHIPDNEEEIPTCVIDMIVYGLRIRIFFDNSFDESYLNWVSFEKVDLPETVTSSNLSTLHGGGLQFDSITRWDESWFSNGRPIAW